MEIPKKYETHAIEEKWKNHWEKQGTYVYDAKDKRPVFSIDTPPPTVSGRMHIGHSFSYAQEDFIARFWRMNGKNVFYPFGTDDNGLATDKLVEKTKKTKAKMHKREDYLQLCHETIKELLPAFVEDWKRLGMSCDFSKPYSTISKEVQAISQKAFIELHEKGLVYRKETPISWCPQCQTAIAQAEFENVNMTSHFNDLIFKAGGKDLVIATTRPELLPACVGLFYHPDDERYTDLKGKHATVPLFDYDVPIMPDETVDREKGTGLMMCCTFGDKEDIEKWYKYHLPLKVVFTTDGKMNEHGQKYEGMRIKEARKAISNDLEEAGLLIASKQITHAVNVHERCGTEIEFANTNQWFINVLDHKEELLAAADKIKWHPAHMKVRYTHWVENLNWDWCISRQRHFGIPFPIWYEKKTDKPILADKDNLPVDPISHTPKGYAAEEVIAETDVIDTWATSSITPRVAIETIGQGVTMPMTVRPQAHDIIRTWAFYTIARGIYHTDNIPWENIMISGFVLDPKGNKMSKSKGNTIAPQDIIKKYGADALRYWAAGSKLGDDLPFMEKDVQTGAKTVTKLWNASKFTLMHLEGYEEKDVELQLIDKWLLSKLQRVVKESTETFQNYEYARTKALVDNFFWNTYCDYYLEIVKDRLYNEDEHGKEAKQSAQHTLHRSLRDVLKLFAPIMPYITEEIYTYGYAKDGKSIHTENWPAIDASLIDEHAEKAGDLLVELLDAVRKKKSEANMSLRVPVKKLTIQCSKEDEQLITELKGDLKAVTRTEEIIFDKAERELREGLAVTILLGKPEKKN